MNKHKNDGYYWSHADKRELASYIFMGLLIALAMIV